MDGWQVLEQAGELAARGEPFALATVVWRQGPTSGQQGSRAIITGSGEIRGWIGGACAEPSVIRQARQVIAEGKPRLLLLGTPERFGMARPGAPAGRGRGARPVAGEQDPPVPEGMIVVPIACQSEGALEVYVEPVLPVPHLVVVGRSPMAQALAGLARVLGWRTDLEDGAEFSAACVTERSMVVIATQGHGDEEAVERAVLAGPAYVGLVASGKRGAAVLGYLADRGVPRERLDQVRAPCGLDLGHTTHTEVAVAILAELVRLRASGELAAGGGPVHRAGMTRAAAHGAAAAGRAAPADPGRGRGQGGSGHGAAGPGGSSAAGPGPGEAGEATDPVCGMTVTAGPGARPLEHDGVTYYFCCAGCRAAFESDPASPVRRQARC